jgi:site-specific recombinase XerD
MRLVAITTSSQRTCYVVVDQHGHLVEPIVRYLKQLDQRGYARNTLRAYGTSLALFFTFLHQHQRAYLEITVDDLAAFVHWLRWPYPAPHIVPIQPLPPARSNCTINHILKAVASFYDDLWRRDLLPTDLSEKTRVVLAPRARTYRNFLYHLTRGQPVERHLLKQPAPKRRPKTLTPTQVETLIAACHTDRDRLLIHLLYESGMRIGEALGLWLEDIDLPRAQLHIQDRGPLSNGAEIKTPAAERAIDVSADLIAAIMDYLVVTHTDQVHTNHLFLKHHGPHTNEPLTYADVMALFRRLRQQTNIPATPHMLRHSHFTALAKHGWAPEHLRVRAGHRSFQTTYNLYVHPNPEDLRAAWEQTQGHLRVQDAADQEEPQWPPPDVPLTE